MSTVKLRALMVDNLLRPLLDPINKIVIKDPSDIRVMQWTNVSVIATQGTCDVTATSIHFEIVLCEKQHNSYCIQSQQRKMSARD